MPNLYILAGPNGAVKTTAAYTVLPEVLGVLEFISADGGIETTVLDEHIWTTILTNGHNTN